jgi:hypothetical protein
MPPAAAPTEIASAQIEILLREFFLEVLDSVTLYL